MSKYEYINNQLNKSRHILNEVRFVNSDSLAERKLNKARALINQAIHLRKKHKRNYNHRLDGGYLVVVSVDPLTVNGSNIPYAEPAYSKDSKIFTVVGLDHSADRYPCVTKRISYNEAINPSKYPNFNNYIYTQSAADFVADLDKSKLTTPHIISLTQFRDLYKNKLA